MDIVSTAVRSVVSIILDAVRLLVRHWPVLTAFFLVGSALHGALLWLTVWVSQYSGIVAMLLLPFAPLSMLMAMVFMLRFLAPALPGIAQSATGASTWERFRSTLVITAHVLVPFLAVYASQGMVKSDLKTFMFNTTIDEYFNKGFGADFGRVLFVTDSYVIVVVLIALVIRKIIAGFGLAKKHLSIATFASYLESLWLVVVASWFAASLNQIRDWVESRVVIVTITDWLDHMTSLLGPVGDALNWGFSQLASVLGGMGHLVVIPVSWLAVGATIYGSSLPDAEPLSTPEDVTRRLQRIPNPVRRVGAQVVEPITSPVKNTIKAISRVAVAGVLPMVFLCLLLTLASQLRVGVTVLIRGIIGPQEPMFWVSIAPIVDIAAQCVYTVVMIVVIAATVNTIILSTNDHALAAQEEEADDSAESETALAGEASPADTGSADSAWAPDQPGISAAQ